MRHGFCFLFFLLWDGILLEGSKEEIQLRKNLFANYSMVLPVEFPNSPLLVTFRLVLYRITELDERNQALVTNVEVVLLWKDAYLKWDTKDYGGIEQIMVPYASIWTPDIILGNRYYNFQSLRNPVSATFLLCASGCKFVSTNYAERLLTTNAIVSSTGEVALLTAANFRSTCDVDVSSFPFDIQNCTMRFGSWSYDMTMVTRSLLFCLPNYIFLYTNGSPQLLGNSTLSGRQGIGSA
ncbi:unnamed protein product [Darwinula stevensoni]|uniref:Neurotransmitter-gated ion-channel ligand-binding domain-containing protein n=1 Tax=Darwinula stevensoni TaxID=69355 RepID=A0A7R9AAB0_9CRUS|nr:unnamed protein product [Darwinula stevensoni]CAG0898234.1 unnamed protein product [Darwinula stevensoni]